MNTSIGARWFALDHEKSIEVLTALYAAHPELDALTVAREGLPPQAKATLLLLLQEDDDD
jgi:hypothetical protein